MQMEPISERNHLQGICTNWSNCQSNIPLRSAGSVEKEGFFYAWRHFKRMDHASQHYSKSLFFAPEGGPHWETNSHSPLPFRQSRFGPKQLPPPPKLKSVFEGETFLVNYQHPESREKPYWKNHCSEKSQNCWRCYVHLQGPYFKSDNTDL